MESHPLRALRGLSLILVGLSLAVATTACGPSEPIQPIAFNNRLSMNLSQKWVFQRKSGKKAFYSHGDSKGVRLSFEDQSREYGVPMTVQSVRGAIGTELNLAHGGVTSRTTLSHTALIDYSGSTKEGRKRVYTRNWVVARPLGATAVARVAVTLRMPDGEQNSTEMQALMEQLDKQLGDAKMPEV